MNLAGKLQLKPGQSIAVVNQPPGSALGTDLNRDVLAGLVKTRGLQPVRQVAPDDVWSALRLRPA